MLRWMSVLIVVGLLLAGCQGTPTTAPTAAAPAVLRLATTTSTQDSGLLDVILPVFEKQYNARVDVVAVGTGQALALGASGDADVVLVHARAQEDAFVAAGDGLPRHDVMYNDFVIVGPAGDPAEVIGATSAAQAFTRIADAKAPFASRGDNSGTHTKEKSIWAKAAMTPTVDTGWYFSLGQGMGETLTFANEKGAYTLSDRATFLAQQENVPNLKIVFGGGRIEDNPDKALYNPYGVIPVNPEKHPGVNADLAQKFVDWIISADTQKLIGSFGVDKFGQSLFRPNATP
jgi:tungstate transport system substrate-binding protein